MICVGWDAKSALALRGRGPGSGSPRTSSRSASSSERQAHGQPYGQKRRKGKRLAAKQSPARTLHGSCDHGHRAARQCSEQAAIPRYQGKGNHAANIPAPDRPHVRPSNQAGGKDHRKNRRGCNDSRDHSFHSRVFELIRHAEGGKHPAKLAGNDPGRFVEKNDEGHDQHTRKNERSAKHRRP